MSKQSNTANIYGGITDVLVKTVSFQLTPNMNGFWIRCQSGGGAITVTVPVGLQEGFACVLFNEGANPVTIVAGAGAIVNSVGGFLSITSQYGEAGLFSYASNTYKATGNLA